MTQGSPKSETRIQLKGSVAPGKDHVSMTCEMNKCTNPANHLIMSCICAKLMEIIVIVLKKYQSEWSQFTTGHNSVKTVGRFIVVVLCPFSDNALYLYHISSKYF